MSLPAPSLPDGWIERIFAQMRATYGATFDRQWECPEGQEPAEHAATLKAHWAKELGGFTYAPSAIAYALKNLPAFPPNLIEFRALCNRCPIDDREVKAIAGPKELAAPETVAKAREFLRSSDSNPRAWVARLRARINGGYRPTIAQREMLESVERGDF